MDTTTVKNKFNYLNRKIFRFINNKKIEKRRHYY